MFCDIVFPQNNEEAFLKRAFELNVKNICFIYDFSKNFKQKIEIFNSLEQKKSSDVNIFLGAIVQKNQVNSAKNFCDLTLLKGTTDRDIFKQGADVIFSFETLNNRESIYHPSSGLPISLIRDAKNKMKCIGFSLFDILNAKNKSLFLHKVSFNLKLCSKNKIPVLFGSFALKPQNMRNPSDMASFIRTLGGTSKQSKDSLENCYKIISTNKAKKEGTIIAKGIELKG